MLGRVNSSYSQANATRATVPTLSAGQGKKLRPPHSLPPLLDSEGTRVAIRSVLLSFKLTRGEGCRISLKHQGTLAGALGEHPQQRGYAGTMNAAQMFKDGTDLCDPSQRGAIGAALTIERML